jgi:CP family cyanate transporter-like MFS transporter
LVLVSLLAAAAALRPQLAGIGPLLGPVGRDLGISHAVAGLVATIPVACMGLFAFGSARLMARFGTYPVMTVSLVAITVAGLLRAIAPEAGTVILLTAVFGVGAGVANTLLPGIVKSEFAARVTQVTALYSIALNGAAALAAAIAAPIAQIAGGWRGALAVFGVWDATLTVVWAATARGARWRTPPQAETVGSDDGSQPATGAAPPSRSGVWTLALLFGLQGTVYYGLNAWLASTYKQHGWSSSAAGALVGVLNFSTLPATLAVGALARRSADASRWLIAAAAALALATVGIVLVPAAGFGWSVLAGGALGTIFPLCMAATVDLGRDAHEVTRATGIMLGGGYLVAALAPLVLGALRDATGSFTAGIWMLFGVALCLVAVCVAFSRATRRPIPERVRV